MFCKKGVLRNFTKFKRKHLCQSLFSIKKKRKETLAQVFSREFCEICKNTVFYRTPLVATSNFSKSPSGFSLCSQWMFLSCRIKTTINGPEDKYFTGGFPQPAFSVKHEKISREISFGHADIL